MKKKILNKEIPFPSFWVGYILKPIRIEFFIDGEDRLLDRFFVWTKRNSEWTISRLIINMLKNKFPSEKTTIISSSVASILTLIKLALGNY